VQNAIGTSLGVDEIADQELAALTSNAIAEKSGWPTSAAINGVNESFTKAVTTGPKAPPITTATVRSRTLPRKRNCLRTGQHEGLLAALRLARSPRSVTGSGGRCQVSERLAMGG